METKQNRSTFMFLHQTFQPIEKKRITHSHKLSVSETKHSAIMKYETISSLKPFPLNSRGFLGFEENCVFVTRIPEEFGASIAKQTILNKLYLNLTMLILKIHDNK